MATSMLLSMSLVLLFFVRCQSDGDSSGAGDNDDVAQLLKAIQQSIDSVKQLVENKTSDIDSKIDTRIAKLKEELKVELTIATDTKDIEAKIDNLDKKIDAGMKDLHHELSELQNITNIINDEFVHYTNDSSNTVPTSSTDTTLGTDTTSSIDTTSSTDTVSPPTINDGSGNGGNNGAGGGTNGDINDVEENDVENDVEENDVENDVEENDVEENDVGENDVGDGEDEGTSGVSSSYALVIAIILILVLCSVVYVAYQYRAKIRGWIMSRDQVVQQCLSDQTSSEGQRTNGRGKKYRPLSQQSDDTVLHID